MNSDLDIDAESIPEVLFQEPLMEYASLQREQVIQRIRLGGWFWTGSSSLAGLSTDCRYVYFCHKKELKVYLTRNNHHPALNVFSERFPSSIRSLTCTQNYILVASREYVTLWSISENSGLKKLSANIDKSWLPHDTAMMESRERLLIVIIQDGVNGKSRIAVYDLLITSDLKLPSLPLEFLPWSGSARPKQIAISDDSQVIGCISTEGEENHVLVWRRTRECCFDESPTLIYSYQFTRVSPQLRRSLCGFIYFVETIGTNERNLLIMSNVP